MKLKHICNSMHCYGVICSVSIKWMKRWTNGPTDMDKRMDARLDGWTGDRMHDGTDRQTQGRADLSDGQLQARRLAKHLLLCRFGAHIAKHLLLRRLGALPTFLPFLPPTDRRSLAIRQHI